MIKISLGVILGYIVMAAFVFITFSATYLILGTEGAYEPNSFEVSLSWIIASMVLGLVGAVLGGMTSIAIGKSRKAAFVLAGLVLILGIAMAIPALSAVDAQSLVRTGDVAMMDAMQSAHQPSWLAFLNPVIGAIGVLVGSCLRKQA